MRFEATDGVKLEGLLVGKSKKVAIFIHGLTGNFYKSWFLESIYEELNKKGISLFSINTRGHDVLASGRKGRKRIFVGCMNEIFEDCLKDVGGAIKFLKKNGFKEIYLFGHSTGANKVAYCLEKGVKVKKAIFLAPGDDIGIQKKMLGKGKYLQMQKLAKRLNKNKEMPVKNLGHVPITAGSYNSLFRENSNMDQFPHYELKKEKWKHLRKIKVPSIVLIGEKDEYFSAPLRKIKSFFEKEFPNIPFVIVKGANHGFMKKEKEMAKEVVKFFSN